MPSTALAHPPTSCVNPPGTRSASEEPYVGGTVVLDYCLEPSVATGTQCYALFVSVRSLPLASVGSATVLSRLPPPEVSSALFSDTGQQVSPWFEKGRRSVETFLIPDTNMHFFYGLPLWVHGQLRPTRPHRTRTHKFRSASFAKGGPRSDLAPTTNCVL